MALSVRRDQFGRGVANKVAKGGVPEGGLREAVNLDPMPDGSLALRAGAEEFYGSGLVKGVWAHGDKLLIHDGSTLILMNPATGVASTLGTLLAPTYDHEYFDGRSYLVSQSQNLVVGRDGVLYPWGVPSGTDPVVSVGAGGMMAGVYRLAVTFSMPFEGQQMEGGTFAPVIIQLTEGASLTVTVPAPPFGGLVHLYASDPNGMVLFLQATRATAGTVSITSIDTATRTLGTEGKVQPPNGTRVTQHRGMMAVAADDKVFVTEPMNPFLHNPVRSTYRFPEEVRFLIGDDTGFAVGHPYGVSLLVDAQGDQPALRTLDETPPVMDSGYRTQQGEVLWVTHLGLHKITQQKDTTRIGGALLTQDYAPDRMSSCELGTFDYNGHERVVITPKGNSKANALVACDYYEARVILPGEE